MHFLLVKISQQHNYYYASTCTKAQRVRTESPRTTSINWTKLCTKIINILLQTSVLLFEIFYQKKPAFQSTRNIENKF